MSSTIVLPTSTPPTFSTLSDDEEEIEENQVIQIGSPTFDISSLVTQVQRTHTATPKLTPVGMLYLHHCIRIQCIY
jgi:hypothetical protein